MSSQNISYPKRDIIGNDTVFVLLKEQFIKVNIALEQLDVLKQMNQNLDSQNIMFAQELSGYKKTDSLLNKNIQLKDSVIVYCNKIVIIKDGIIKEQNKKIKSKNWQRTGLAVLSGILVVLLIIK
jgi:predicted house-cleaning NTP pyrophosphatase (Maf/HAM1 superfamily)